MTIGNTTPPGAPYWIIETDASGRTISMRLHPKVWDDTFWFVDPFRWLQKHAYNVIQEDADALSGLVDGDIRVFYWFAAACSDRKAIAGEIVKWMIGPLREIAPDLKVNPEEFGKLVERVISRAITPTMGKVVLARVCKGEAVDVILLDDAFTVLGTNEIETAIDQIIAANPVQAADYRSGNAKAFNWFVGQVMKALKGKVDAAQMRPMLEAKLKSAPVQ